MITIRKSDQRGHANHGWLDTRHTFSFADYHDPDQMGFRALRVINEDRVRGGAGFPTHGHRDMEIVTYVLEGALEHRDSMGNGSVIRPGEVQRMSAGTGVRHSEFNNSSTDTVHFLQIWILPRKAGLPPGYEQKAFAEMELGNRLRLIASPDGRDGSVTIQQDAAVHAGRFDAGQAIRLPLLATRHAWVQVARGRLKLNGHDLAAGDGVAASNENELRIESLEPSELIVFDLA